jgi:hypothetical protein
MQSGLQRYRCRECKRTFNALTGTPLANLRKKALWLDYMQCMLDSCVLREISARMDISTRTTFRWRHRFSDWFGQDQPALLSGIIEAEETFFRESQKGSRTLNRPAHRRGGDGARRGISSDQIAVLTVQDRASHAFEKQIGSGPIRLEQLQQNLNSLIAPDAVLVSDGAQAYNAFCHQIHLDHIVVKNKPGQRLSGSMHLQHVNALHSRLKGWINGHFRGVATKYLDHYLWMKHELEHQNTASPEPLLCASMGNFNYQRQ